MKTKEFDAASKYNLIAQDYHNMRTKTNPKGWFFNEMLEMPMMFKLMGNVRGKKILDFGCGSGIYAKILSKKGAIVKGFDISEGMLKIARASNPDLDLRQGSGYKIPFEEKFDMVISPLVIEYMKDFDKVFTQVSRVLKKDGIFIFSMGNPVSGAAKSVKIGGRMYKVLGKRNYFKETFKESRWRLPNGKFVKMGYYHKTYGSIVKAIVRNGFEIIDYEDTYPINKAKKIFPQYYNFYSKMPLFCAFKVRKK